MTNLEKRKSRLVFTTCDIVRERGKVREVVLECLTTTVNVRLAGMRTSYPISYAAIYNRAVAIAVEKSRAEKKAKRGRRI